MRKIIFSLLFLSILVNASSQTGQYRKPVKPTKNVILMIPDGASLSALAAARWYKTYNKLGNKMYLDEYITGTVQTFCSDAPIGDSAPTTSCYMTGMPQQVNNVAIYPAANPDQDLVTVDPSMAYQPLATILEASKYEQNKATGLVVTVRFAHATPADCSAHHYARNEYEILSQQVAYNNLDVVFGAGNQYITDDIKEHFKNTNTTLIQDDIKAFRKFEGKQKVWALFGDKDMPYHIDRDTTSVPSLSEMTKKAIERLNKDEQGFFLMVEGSKVDWALHGNDPIGAITEYVEFDNAFKVAIDFAKENGETTVVVLADHATGGMTIGRKDLKGYASASIETLFGSVSKFQRTSLGLAEILEKTNTKYIKDVFKKYTDIDLSEVEHEYLLSALGHTEKDYVKVATSLNISSAIARIMTDHTYFAFTTGGHTGEDVILAAYHPKGEVPTALNTNIDINHYLFDVSGLKTSLEEMTKTVYAKHTDVFKGMSYSIDKTNDKFPTLVITKGKVTMKVPAFKSVVYVNDQPINLRSITVYIDKNDTFYLPKNLINKF